MAWVRSHIITKGGIHNRVLQDGELPIDKIAKYSRLDIAEVELLTRLRQYKRGVDNFIKVMNQENDLF